jgi:hypothetical protein
LSNQPPEYSWAHGDDGTYWREISALKAHPALITISRTETSAASMHITKVLVMGVKSIIMAIKI